MRVSRLIRPCDQREKVEERQVGEEARVRTYCKVSMEVLYG
jgi:hypothetical protein